MKDCLRHKLSAEEEKGNAMVIIRVMGGLGNQLQQFALYKKMESLGKEVRLDISWFDKAKDREVLAKRELELEYFDGLHYRTAAPEEVRALLGRLWEEPETAASKLKRKILPALNPCFAETDMYHGQVFAFENKYLVGYWACEKYYADILDGLRREIRFPKSPDPTLQERNEAAAERMRLTESVSVHIRRGDYLDSANSAMFGGICTEAYYDAAIACMRRQYPEAAFFFFSDDIPYVRERYAGEAYEIIDWNQGSDSFYDMMLMSRCKHNICANSTFSFWGARLNAHADKCMIRPSVHKNTQVCVPEQMRSLWQGWTLISPQGQVI